jgi:tetratricopeptide (TPR) repeat protein
MRATRATLLTLLVFLLLAQGCSRKQANRNAGASTADGTSQAGQSGDAHALYDKGMDAYRGNRDQEAVEDFRQATQLDPDFAEAHYRFGLALNVVGDKEEAAKAFGEAIKAYEKRTKQDPKDSDAFYFLGLCYEKLDKYEDAVRALKESVKTSPTENDDKYYELAFANFRLAQYDDSIRALNKTLEINPNNYMAQDLLDKAKEGAQRVDEIRRHQEQLLKQKTANTNANANGNSNSAANTGTNSGAATNKNGAQPPTP